MINVIVEFSQRQVSGRLICDVASNLKVAMNAVILLVIHLLLMSSHLAAVEQTQQQQQQQRALLPAEYQLIGQLGEEVHLPCLIGRQLYCGEPYFIAWYKLNSSSKSWSRIEYKSENELLNSNNNERHQDVSSLFPERFRFSWLRSSSGQQRASARSACEQQQIRTLNNNFDCAQLTISSLELIDEGQYKCEITFSESLDFDKCPATTLSQLNVIARPNEPELLVNGRPPPSNGLPLTFKEGSQVKLECQSSGGRPAPRIEWLNVSGSGQQQSLELGAQNPEVQLLRAWWPQKKAHTFPLESRSADTPITSSSVTITLSRFDLQSRFVCLVVPQQYNNQEKQQQPFGLNNNAEPSYLASLLNQRSANAAAPMLRWLKLDVQVKPSSVSIVVRDVEADTILEMKPASARNNQAHFLEPFYSLQVNRLYAIQCLVENSRPHSQVSWFNRTAPISLEQIQVANSSSLDYYYYPDKLTGSGSNPHRLSSFSRSVENQDKTFRTTATLLLTTNVWDNFEEFFCRVSNEAFQFDELIQVAPITSARLYVNYAPFAWLEAGGQTAPTGNATFNADSNGELTLRCSVAANPLSHNAILQIDWFKDGRKLLSNHSLVSGARQPRIYIEKTNHLHMPQLNIAAAAAPDAQPLGARQKSNQLVASSKLIGVSSLSIKSLLKSDAGLYVCQFKLIPAPIGGGQQSQAAQQQAAQLRITSGQANNAIRVNVAEAKPKAPLIRIAASSTLLVYGGPLRATSSGEKTHQNRLTVVGKGGTIISLKCDMNSFGSKQLEPKLGHKVMWYLNGFFIHSSNPTEVYNFTLMPTSESNKLGSLTCAHHILGSTNSPENFHGSLMRVYQSSNEINLKLQVGPSMLAKRDLMPPVRSFSAPELSANSANKLRLVCLAKCEPICSIDWYFSLWRRPRRHSEKDSVSPTFAGAVDQRLLASMAGANEAGGQLSETQPPSKTANQSLFVFKSAIEFDGQQIPLSHFLQVENLIHRQNASNFTWIRQSSLTSQQNGATESAQPDWSSLQLMREAQTYLGDANVMSKLELTYNQIGRLLEEDSSDSVEDDNKESSPTGPKELLVKCKLNSILDGQQQQAGRAADFQHILIEPERWFPEEEEGSASLADIERARKRPFVISNSTNFVASAAPSNDIDYRDSPETLDNEAQKSSATVWDDQRKQSEPQDEMQIRILLDGPPKSASIQIVDQAGSGDQQQAGTMLKLTDTQLLQMADATRAPTILKCQVGGNPYPVAQFKWTFTSDLNQTTHSLAVDGPQLNLRQLIEFRQRQLNVDALGIDVVASLIGNYTCTAFNVYGSKSASVTVQTQGRPLCKLTLSSEYLSPDNELMANLKCFIHSMPPLLDTVWYRNNQQLLVNKTSANMLAEKGNSPLSTVELPVMVLNKQQSFMLSDLMNQVGNFKCAPRNSHGFSEPCELNPTDRQTLLNILKATDGQQAGLITKTTTLSSKLAQTDLAPSSNRSPANIIDAILFNGSSSSPAQVEPGSGAGSPLVLMVRFLSARLDWLMAAICSVALIWILFMFGNSFVSRRYGMRKLRKGIQSRTLNQNTSWRFSSSDRRSISNKDNEVVGGPLSQTKLCANYYGGSTNGDSEQDMVQSCSQSSHYEDFMHHQLQQQQQQRLLVNGNGIVNRLQPLYSTSGQHLTLNRRQQLKSSLSGASSTGDSSTESRQHHLIRQLNANEANANRAAFGGGATMRQQRSNASANLYTQGLTLSSNVPLITGSNTSRINLDSHHQKYSSFGVNNVDQKTFISSASQQLDTNEPIYDDVIYNQMIL